MGRGWGAGQNSSPAITLPNGKAESGPGLQSGRELQELREATSG